MGAETAGGQEAMNAPKKTPRKDLKALFDSNPELQAELKKREEGERKQSQQERADAEALLKTL